MAGIVDWPRTGIRQRQLAHCGRPGDPL